MKQLNAAVEKHRQLILDTERWIWKHPETGYKEFKTSAHVAEIFENLGYDLVMAEGITGFAGDKQAAVDAVSGATLVDTYGYLLGILAAAQAAK